MQRTKVVFEDATGQFSAGIWATTAYERRILPFPRYELMHIVEGETAFPDADGDGPTFRAGDTFLVPLGAETGWRGAGDLRKVYCSFQPAPADRVEEHRQAVVAHLARAAPRRP